MKKRQIKNKVFSKEDRVVFYTGIGFTIFSLILIGYVLYKTAIDLA